jgi:hypothetical protein
LPQHRASAPPQAAPAEIARVATAARLGRLLHVYQPKRQNWFLIAFMFLVGLATAIVLVGLWILWMIFRTPNLSKSVGARRIYLYEQGFVLVERPEDPQVYRWDAIDTVFQKIVSQSYNGVPTGTKYFYTINRRDGATAEVTLFWEGCAQFGAHVNESVSAALLPRAVAAIERGQGIQFGDMTLTRDGIAGKRQSVTWAQVSGIQVANGFVRVKVQGKTLSLSTTAASDLPNLPLFLTLANRLHRVGQAAR